jgi:hypothetical protein
MGIDRACALRAILISAALGAPLSGQVTDTVRAPMTPAAVQRRHHTVQNTVVFAGLSVVSFGVIWMLPEDVSKWPKEDRSLNHFLDAYRKPPVWDSDAWFWNYLAHPVAGAWGYLAERNHGESKLRSFLFSTATTAIGWEYGVEAWIEHPSAQDLLITSTTGSVLGELSYRATQRMSRNGFTRIEKVTVWVINPLWPIQRGFATR